MTEYTVLCFGDSNTWGFDPESSDFAESRIARYPRHCRWTGRLQRLLGESFTVIEEGLNGRTTDLDHSEPPDRNGHRYLAPCLYSHAPVDLVILALGANDLKTHYQRTPKQITHALAKLIDTINLFPFGKELKQAPRTLVLSPIVPLPICEAILDDKGTPLFEKAISRAREMIHRYRELAATKQVEYLDISERISPSPLDGAHLDAKAHALLADILYTKVRQLFAK